MEEIKPQSMSKKEFGVVFTVIILFFGGLSVLANSLEKIYNDEHLGEQYWANSQIPLDSPNSQLIFTVAMDGGGVRLVGNNSNIDLTMGIIGVEFNSSEINSVDLIGQKKIDCPITANMSKRYNKTVAELCGNRT